MRRITKETLKEIGFRVDWETESNFFKDIEPTYEGYVSLDKRYLINRSDKYKGNIGENGWHLHVDNSDFQTIANCDVEYIEQVEIIMELYKNY